MRRLGLETLLELLPPGPLVAYGVRAPSPPKQQASPVSIRRRLEHEHPAAPGALTVYAALVAVADADSDSASRAWPNSPMETPATTVPIEAPAAASPLRVPKVLWARVRAEARRVGRQAAAEARQAAAARRQSEMAAAAARVEDSLAAADASGDESLLVPSAAVEPSWMWPAPRSAASPKTGGSWVDRLARGCLAPVYDFIDAAKQAAAEQEAGREDEARRTQRAAASPLKVKAGSPVRGSGPQWGVASPLSVGVGSPLQRGSPRRVPPRFVMPTIAEATEAS